MTNVVKNNNNKINDINTTAIPVITTLLVSEFFTRLISGKVAKRPKPPRAMKSERTRGPFPIPRPTKPGKLSHGHPRPSPLSRKRRLSVRLARPAQVSSVSEEGDMAQADEMGEGEGRDDGFVEGLDPVGRRRNKKRSGEFVDSYFLVGRNLSEVVGMLDGYSAHFVSHSVIYLNNQ